MKKENTTTIKSGFTLLEILVVIVIFAVLGVVVTKSIFLTLGGSRKSDSQVNVRENVNYAFSVMERLLRNANSITSCADDKVTYTDENNFPASFSCNSSEDSIASGSARLTSEKVKVSTCSFTCTLGQGGIPPSVTVAIEAEDAFVKGAEGSKVKVSTKVFLRTY